MIVELAAAELAQGERSPSDRAWPSLWRGREPMAFAPSVPLIACDLGDDRLGDVGELASDLADRLAAEDVAGADAHPFLVAEAPEDRRQVFGPFAQLGQLGLDRRPGQGAIDDQRVHQVVDHAGVADQDLREELAGRAELDVEPQAGRVEVEQLPEDRLGRPATPRPSRDSSGSCPGRRSAPRPGAIAGRSTPGSGGSGACDRNRKSSRARAIRLW